MAKKKKKQRRVERLIEHAKQIQEEHDDSGSAKSSGDAVEKTRVSGPIPTNKRRGVNIYLDRKLIRQIIFLLAIGMAFYWLAQNVQILPDIFSWLRNRLAPILHGIFLAILINIPTRGIEQRILRRPWRRMDWLREKIRRPISIFFAILLFLAIVAGFILLVIPELERTLKIFGPNLTRFLNEGGKFVDDYVKSSPDLEAALDALNLDYQAVVDRILTWFMGWSQRFMDSTLNIALTIVNSFVTFFLSLVFALYAIGAKDSLGVTARKLSYAFLPEKNADRLINGVSLSVEVFSDYFMAQGLEAIILGSLIYFSMWIFGMPYRFVISAIVAVFALIPIFGAYISAALGSLLILMTESPGQAMSFLIMYIIVQQFEGNVIYPRVMGNRMGLPPFWIFTAVILGGKFFGFFGFLLAVPATSVIYILLTIESERRVKQRDIDPDKIELSVTQRLEDDDLPEELPAHEGLIRRARKFFRGLFKS